MMNRQCSCNILQNYQHILKRREQSEIDSPPHFEGRALKRLAYVMELR